MIAVPCEHINGQVVIIVVPHGGSDEHPVIDGNTGRQTCKILRIRHAYVLGAVIGKVVLRCSLMWLDLLLTVSLEDSANPRVCLVIALAHICSRAIEIPVPQGGQRHIIPDCCVGSFKGSDDFLIQDILAILIEVSTEEWELRIATFVALDIAAFPYAYAVAQ